MPKNTDWHKVYRYAGRLIDASPGLDGETAFKLALAQVEREADQGTLSFGELKRQLAEL